MAKYLKLFFVILCSCHSYISYSQNNLDWKMRSSVSMRYNLNEKTRLISKFEYRLKDNLTEKDRWNVNTTVRYDILKNIEIDTSYELHYLKDYYGKNSFIHRFNISSQAYIDYQNFEFSLRERLQNTFSDSGYDFYLRSRFMIEYKKYPVRPNFSIEVFQKMNSSNLVGIDIVRYRPKLTFRISEKVSCCIFYCREYQKHITNNIIGADCIIDL